jgi:hypothetical protein
MPHGRPDPADPNMLVGVRLPADEDGLHEMAYTFAEEFAALGHDQGRILRMFRNPRFGGPHAAYRELGEGVVLGIVAECARVFGRHRMVVRDAGPIDGSERLGTRRED